jgi:hypothetical protein
LENNIVDITTIAQKLIEELEDKQLTVRGMMEGVALLHDRIRNAIEAEKQKEAERTSAEPGK